MLHTSTIRCRHALSPLSSAVPGSAAALPTPSMSFALCFATPAMQPRGINHALKMLTRATVTIRLPMRQSIAAYSTATITRSCSMRRSLLSSAISLTHPLSQSPSQSKLFHPRPFQTSTYTLISAAASPPSSIPPIVESNSKQEDSKQDQQHNRSHQSNSKSSTFNPFRYIFHKLRAAFEWYAGKLDTNPVVTQGLTSGFLFAIGDITAQRYEDRLDRAKGIDTSGRPYLDWIRLAACTSFGLFLLGPLGHHWYSRLDIFTNKIYKPRTLKNVGLKVLLDTAIFNPIFLVIFFTVVSLLEGLTFNDIGRKIYRDFVPSYAVDCSVWPPIQTVNFRFVPVKFQLLVVNLGCYFDDVFLSYVQHNGMPYIFQSIERAWLEWIGDESVVGGGHGHGHGHATQPDATPLIEHLNSGDSPSGQAVMLVPTDEKHPHHPHSHPITKSTSTSGIATTTTPLPHHHIVPRVLVENDHHIARSHGVDSSLVEELDADWTDVPADTPADGEKSSKDTANKK